MSSRKRKADDDNDEMSVSPTNSPSISTRQIARASKKPRSVIDNRLDGRPLPLPRLLETLDKTQLRMILHTICERHPDLGREVVNSAPRPTVASALHVLEEYQEKLKAAMPLGNSSSDYVYFRVKQHLSALIDAIWDFTPQYLPPLEQQTSISLQYLDSATDIIHALPDWESFEYRQHKEKAYEEMSQAWALVINEGAKRGGGIILHSGGWDQTLSKHNQRSGGRLQLAMQEMANVLGWMGTDSNASGAGASDSILSQLLNGTYGSPVRVGPR
ncbi:tethering factor for nuclear proteasome STS1 [Echria macrotheca]|uniref:Tethering factor for nuclear proteasome STS1 n=1 Tax=Echria macrotheca TaxID=438768 RepID=A0AAJ0FGY4_9PEZI|nr:tethering factor for nuclear proteasome STS1 [Echria macrotheca]